MTKALDKQPQAVADPRVYFAAERTLLAWVRTGLAMMGFGFVVARFGAFFREMALIQHVAPPAQTQLSLWVGLALVVAGVSVNLAAAIRHWRTIRRLEKGQPIRFHPLALGGSVAVLLALIGMALAGYLLGGNFWHN